MQTAAGLSANASAEYDAVISAMGVQPTPQPQLDQLVQPLEQPQPSEPPQPQPPQEPQAHAQAQAQAQAHV